MVLLDSHDPRRQVELPARVVRFGPPGWLTVVHGEAEATVVALYSTARVLEVSDLGEAGLPVHGPVES